MSEFKQGSHFDSLYKAGGKMGFAKGGKVQKMDSMDTGVQPARKGRNQQEVEAGGTKRMTPGYDKGGKAKKKRSKVKARGGLAHASKYKHGGPYKSEPMFGDNK